MTDNFQGDPALFMGQNGAEIIFRGGQPIMDQGLHNDSQISLFTAEGWGGNFLNDTEEQNIGSDFEKTARKTITLTSLALVEKSAENALTSKIYGTKRATFSNPNSVSLTGAIRIEPPASDADAILLIRNGINWINQAASPAHGKV